jgi:signal transduction histidine kinase
MQSDRRGWIVSAALFAPLVVLLVVAGRTWRAERRYAAVTERVIQDYSGIAAWQYARKADAALHTEVMHAFGGIASGHRRVDPQAALEPPNAILAIHGTGQSALLDSARFVFTYDAESEQIETAGTVDEATLALLSRRLKELLPNVGGDGEPHRMLFDSSGGSAYAVALWTVRPPDRPLRGAYGVVSDPRALRARLLDVIAEPGLLPGTAATERLSHDDLAIRLTRRDGGVVFATSQALSHTAATDSSTLQWGELRTTADLSPRLANALLVGDAPASQLPALVAMILAAAVVAGVGLVQVRRSRDLARVRSRFVANVSHELRTPLAQISMFAETLSLGRERSVGEGRQFARIIHAEARRLTALVESVLRFSRLESGRNAVRAERVDIAGEVRDAVESFAPIADVAEITIRLDLDEAFAAVDQATFRQVLLNLLDNAVKHGGRGKDVHIATRSVDGQVQVLVDDAGAGVPEAWRARVFDPFVRIEKGQGNTAGAGIGLAVVRDLVLAHGGHVWIDASPLGGARFVVSLRESSRTVPQPKEPAEAHS